MCRKKVQINMYLKLLNSMGCKLSRTCEDKETTNSNDNVLEEPPIPQPPDPRLPLTAKQKYNMVASWKGISRAMEPTGILMFIK